MDTLSKEYKEHLKSLKEVSLKQLLRKFKKLENYSDKERYLNEEIFKGIIEIFEDKEFIELYYLDNQAEFIKKKFNLKDLKSLKTLVYCYNTNSREFDKRVKEQKLKEELLKRGFREQGILRENELKDFDGLKVTCVLDVSKIGLLGSFDKKEEIEGKLTYSEYQKHLMLIPKRCRTRGHIIRNKFYYKESK